MPNTYDKYLWVKMENGLPGISWHTRMVVDVDHENGAR